MNKTTHAQEQIAERANSTKMYQWNAAQQPKNGAFSRQVGGAHYKTLAIQPMEFSLRNKLDFATSNAIKYLVRRKDGGADQRAQDLRKAIHCIELLAAHEGLTL